MTQQPTALYRLFLREAWRLTWQRKNLWVFGIFAALISTGGVMDLLFASLKKVEVAGSLFTDLAQSSFSGYKLAGTYIQQMTLLEPGRLTVVVTVAALTSILLVSAATIAQGALVLGLYARKPEHLFTLKMKAAEYFWPLLLIALLNKLASGLAVFLLAMLLFVLSLLPTMTSAGLFFLLALILIPAQIAIHIIYQFTLLGVIHHRLSPLSALAQACRLFTKHWLATLEYGLILFALVVLTLFAVVMIRPLRASPCAVLLSSTLLAGSVSLVLGVNLLLGIVFVGLLLTFVGATVTFQYSAWYEFYKHGLHRVHGKKIFSKILRLVNR